MKRNKFTTASIFICVTFALLGLTGLIPHGNSNLWSIFGPLLIVTGLRLTVLFFQTLMESAQKKQHLWLIFHLLGGLLTSIIYYFQIQKKTSN